MPFAGRRLGVVDRPRSSYAVEPIARPPSGRPPDDETRIFLDRCAHGWKISREKHAARGPGPMAPKANRPQRPNIPNQGTKTPQTGTNGPEGSHPRRTNGPKADKPEGKRRAHRLH